MLQLLENDVKFENSFLKYLIFWLDVWKERRIINEDSIFLKHDKRKYTFFIHEASLMVKGDFYELNIYKSIDYKNEILNMPFV